MQSHSRSRIVLSLAVLGLILGGSGIALPAHAEEIGYRGWGPRVGMTMNPDQVHFGAHLDFGNIGGHIRLQPNLEVGIGDDLTVLALNGEGAYRFSSEWDSWTPYLGGGLGLHVVGTEDGGLVEESETQFGLSALGGIDKGLSNGSRIFFEGKAGFVDAPEFKFAVGYTFAHGAGRPIPGR